jgi:hypothetical protein
MNSENGVGPETKAGPKDRTSLPQAGALLKAERLKSLRPDARSDASHCRPLFDLHGDSSRQSAPRHNVERKAT